MSNDRERLRDFWKNTTAQWSICRKKIILKIFRFWPKLALMYLTKHKWYLFLFLRQYSLQKMNLKIAKIRSFLSIGRLYVVKRGIFNLSMLEGTQMHALGPISTYAYLYHLKATYLCFLTIYSIYCGAVNWINGLLCPGSNSPSIWDFGNFPRKCTTF